MKILLPAILIALLFGCQEKDPVPVNSLPPETWRLKREFISLSKIKINSFSTPTHLFLYGPGSFSSVDGQNEVLHYATRLQYPAFHRLPISTNYFVEAKDNWLRFGNILTPVYDESAAWVDVRGLSPDVQALQYGTQYQINVIDINEKGQCLVPVHTKSSGKEIILYLFSTALNNDNMLKVTDTIRVDMTNPSVVYDQYVYCTKGIKDYFIVSVDGATFKIYSDGSYKKVIDTSVRNVFRYGNKLYGIKQFSQLFISEDEGETWEAFRDFPDGMVLANYFVVADSLIATYQSSLYTLRLLGKKYHINRLQDEGLETNEITSISVFGDSVYVATYSGIFVKHKSKFFSYKKME